MPGGDLGRRLLRMVARAGLSFASFLGAFFEILAAAHLGVCWPDGCAVAGIPLLPLLYTARNVPASPLAEEILAETPAHP
ncbi:MAG: hypothetical protein QM757_22825 [Paludibaculum sp.]